MAEDAADRLGAKLQALYESASPDEQTIVDFLLKQAAEHIGESSDVQGYGKHVEAAASRAGTQDAMKRVLFGAADVTGGRTTRRSTRTPGSSPAAWSPSVRSRADGPTGAATWRRRRGLGVCGVYDQRPSICRRFPDRVVRRGPGCAWCVTVDDAPRAEAWAPVTMVEKRRASADEAALRLQALYDGLPADEREVMDLILRGAAAHIAESAGSH